ncbi:MAG: hypothetical protein ACYTKD_21735 [Planctomycetota bacterium]|jgi:hypothetical protein
MTLVAGILVFLAAAYLARRGYQRGAAAVLRGWLPRFSALAGLYLTAWLTWWATGSLTVTCLLGGAAAILVFGVAALALRPSRRRAEERRQPGDDPPMPGVQPSFLSRLAGSALGVLHAEICCLGLACLGSTVVFGVSVSRVREPGIDSTAPPPEWVEGLGDACRTVADISDVGLLRRLPLLKEYGREVLPLIVILSAPREKLARVAEKRDLMRFADTPAVQAALRDVEYCSLLRRARRGELSALRSLLGSPVTRELVSCPEIREFARTVTPSELLGDMEEGDTPFTTATAAACDDRRLSAGD